MQLSAQRPIHLKKGQFMSPWNMKNSVRKLESFDCYDIILTDRGTFFGYNMLVNDFRSLPIMAEFGYPVCLMQLTQFSCLHLWAIYLVVSVNTFLPVRAACSVGINALFMEVHDDPPNALSDSNTVLDLKYLKLVLSHAKHIHTSRQEFLDKLGLTRSCPIKLMNPPFPQLCPSWLIPNNPVRHYIPGSLGICDEVFNWCRLCN